MGSIHRIGAAAGTSCFAAKAAASHARQTPALPRRDALRALGLLGLMQVAGPSWATTAAAPAATSFYSNFKGLKLLDQDGKPLTIEALAQRTVLINFVYTGCSTVCPVQTRALAEMQRQLPAPLRQRFHLLSLSLDPLGDTPPALRAFATRMGADLSGWTFATGRPADMEKLSEALRLFRPGSETRKLEDHSTALWLVDNQGQLRMRYAGNPLDAPRLLREAAALDRLNLAVPPRKT